MHPTSTHQPNLRILVAEDNPVNQKVVQRLLKCLGYKADFVSNGQEALNALANQPYDVVFLDIQMPIMDGFTAARTICQWYPSDGKPQLIALTASTLTEDREQCFQAGMDHFVGKPILLDELQQVLQKCWL